MRTRPTHPPRPHRNPRRLHPPRTPHTPNPIPRRPVLTSRGCPVGTKTIVTSLALTNRQATEGSKGVSPRACSLRSQRLPCSLHLFRGLLDQAPRVPFRTLHRCEHVKGSGDVTPRCTNQRHRLVWRGGVPTGLVAGRMRAPQDAARVADGRVTFPSSGLSVDSSPTNGPTSFGLGDGCSGYERRCVMQTKDSTLELPPRDLLECPLCGTRLRRNEVPDPTEVGRDMFLPIACHRCAPRITPHPPMRP